MAGANMAEQVRDGMHVQSSDGKRLGKVRQIHMREADVYLEVIPGGPFWKRWQVEPKNLFLPASAVAEVSGRQVTLNMDAKAARTCTRRPPWIPGVIVDPSRGPGATGSG